MAERMGRLSGWLVLAVSAALGAVHVGGPTWEDKLYGAMAGVLLMGLVVLGLAAEVLRDATLAGSTQAAIAKLRKK